ncbi:MAG TPA: lysylphosphatidylglycerol synthase transmembrane domain-containing protein [Planctomycetia bacterium]|nr:lysylphosphatidylglycerol synthase transmembrane domain-containing protein [Planctomycetia bacterium]
MSQESAALKHRIWLSVKVLVTLCLVGWVLWKVEWKDSLRTEGGATLHGFARTVDGTKQFFASSGEILPMPAPPSDPSIPDAYTPGFIRLLWNVNKPLLLVAFVLFSCHGFLLSIRWQWLLHTHGLDPGFWESARLTWIGLVANNVMPSSIGGDAIKAVCISRRTPNKRMEAVMTVLVDRALGLVALLAVASVAILAQWNEPALAKVRVGILAGLFGILIGAFIFFSGRFRRVFRVNELLAKLPGGPLIARLDNALYHYRHHPWTMARAVGISVFLHVWTITMVMLMGWALGMKVPPICYYMFVPLIWISGAFLPSIGGIGVLESGFAYFFSLPMAGATASSAVALCILYRMVQLLMCLPGVGAAHREMSRKKKPLAEAPVLAPTPEPALAQSA